ncbi:MAG: PEP-CTERM sorting domain-containing protein [Verrucomicrobiales bacterium]|nr:PEP-CTERM sorting domain-containing protein [Verrucomicrobiales bacterium]
MKQLFTVLAIAGMIPATGYAGLIYNVISESGGTITTDQGDLTSSSTFMAGDSLVISSTVMQGFDWNTWNLTNLDIQYGSGGANDQLRDMSFVGATFNNTQLTQLAHEARGFQNSTTAAFAGQDLTGLTLNIRGGFNRSGNGVSGAMEGADFNGAVINFNNAESGGAGNGGPRWGGNMSLGGSTYTVMDGNRPFNGSDLSNGSYKSITFELISASSAQTFRDATFAMGTVSEWTGADITIGSGLSFLRGQNDNLDGVTFDLQGATIVGDLFFSDDSLTADLRGADISGVTDLSTDLTGLLISASFDDTTVLPGGVTQADLIGRGWDFVAVPEPGSVFSLVAAFGLLGAWGVRRRGRKAQEEQLSN